MARVASLYLPQLAIERLRRAERPAKPPERPWSAAPVLPAAIDDDPGACSVPRGRGRGRRPGARWAQDEAAGREAEAEHIVRLPAHQRPPMRELGRRYEATDHPFRAMPSDEGGRIPQALPVAAHLFWGKPTILTERRGQREVVTAACPIALSLGLAPGMAATHARALVGNLDIRDADPARDAAWLDLTGASHLFGGEQRFCRRMLRLLTKLGLTGRIAVAGTPGAAHALARYGGEPSVILPPGREVAALAGLPIVALRLEATALAAAAWLELERVGDLYPMPRGPLARRLGFASVTRLDQALGRAAESIAQVIDDLVGDLATLLQKRGLGARTVTLTAERVDGTDQHLGIGASRATRDAKHLVRMFGLKIERLEPGLGIEAMRLTMPHSEPLGALAFKALLREEGAVPDLAPAIDQLAGRAGAQGVLRIGLEESDVPERAVRRLGPLVDPLG